MLIAAIPFKDYKSTKQLLQQAHKQVDGAELRLDYCKQLNLKEIADLRSEFTLPLIFTLRKKSQGGLYAYEEHQRLQTILELCKLEPDYIDLESEVPTSFAEALHRLHPKIKLICSYHNFIETPADLRSIFDSLQQPCFYTYKLATKANKTLDALRMLTFVNSSSPKQRLTGVCMGDLGQCTRIVGPLIGNTFNYTKLENNPETAPGQLTAEELLTTYRFRQLNPETKIFALLGDPIHQSIGHILHNQALELLHENALYLKLAVTPEDLPLTLEYCSNLPFSGFSVTMPLKEAILPLLEELEPATQAIKAINTVQRIENKYVGFNTDGIGAIKSLSERMTLAKQKILILGAGGSARAIAYEAIRHKAEVILLNRTFSKAATLAAELGAEALPFNEMTCLKKINYSVLINTLPESAYAEPLLKKIVAANQLREKTFAMDIVYLPLETAFLKLAKSANCICIPGHEMYTHQALMQIKQWFQPQEKQLEEIKFLMKQFFFKNHPSTYVGSQKPLLK